MNSIKLVLGGLALAALTGCKTDLVCDGTGVITGGLEPDKTVPEFFSTVIWDGWFSSPTAEKMDEHGTALFYSDATDPGTKGKVLVDYRNPPNSGVDPGKFRIRRVCCRILSTRPGHLRTGAPGIGGNYER